MGDEDYVLQDTLRRAMTAISNLRACARRDARYNEATRLQADGAVAAINALLNGNVDQRCIVSVLPCNGGIAKCSCGWEQHHSSTRNARYDGDEHERNQAHNPEETARG